MGKQFLNFNVPTTQYERLRERAHVESFPGFEVPYMIGNVLLTLTVLAPFQNREGTYTDSACPI